MGKRGADSLPLEEECIRYPDGRTLIFRPNETHIDNPPVRATAAQLARRKIAQPARPSRCRGASPAMAAPPNNNAMPPFSSNNAFGQSSTNNVFGQSSTNNAFGQPSQQSNGQAIDANDLKAVVRSKFGAFNLEDKPQPSGPSNGMSGMFSFGSSFGSNQQQGTASSFGGFGQGQQDTITPATAATSTFGSFGKPQEQNGASLFGQPQQSSGFGSFGKPQEQNSASSFGQPQQSSGFGSFGKPQEQNDASSFGQPQQSDGSGLSEQKKLPTFGLSQQQEQPAAQQSKPRDPPRRVVSQPSSITMIHQPLQNGTQTPAASTHGPIPRQAAQPNGEQKGLFGAPTPRPQAQSNGEQKGLFGAPTPRPQAQSNGEQKGLFGAPTPRPQAQSNGEQKGLFGAPTPRPQAQSNGEQKGLFGALTPPPAQPNGEQKGLFSAPTSQQPAQSNGEQKGLFGATIGPFEPPKNGGSVFDDYNNRPPRKSSFVFTSSDPSQIYQPKKKNHASDNNDEQAMEEDDDEQGVEDDNDEQAMEDDTDKQAAESRVVGKLGGPLFLPSTNSSFPPINSESPATKSRSIFDRMDPADRAKLGSPKTAAVPQKSLLSKEPETPAATPLSAESAAPKPRSLFDRMEPAATAPSAENSTPKPRSLFDRVQPADQAKVIALSNAGSPQKSKAFDTSATSQPSTLLATQDDATKESSPFPKPASQPSSELFAPATPQPAAPTAFKVPVAAPLASAAAPSAPLSGKTPETAATSQPSTLLATQNDAAKEFSPFPKPASQPSPELFAPATPQPAAPTAFKVPVTAPPTRAAAPSAPLPKFKTTGPSVAAEELSPEQQARLKSLNDGLLAHLRTQVLEQDWTPIFQYYTEQAAKIRGVELPPAPTSSATQPHNDLFSKPAAPKATETATASAAGKKRPFIEEGDDEPAQTLGSEKRSKLNDSFSKLSETSSASQATGAAPAMKAVSATTPAAGNKRPFTEDDDDDPAQTPGSEKRSKLNESSSKPSETTTSAAELFSSSFNKSASTTTPAASSAAEASKLAPGVTTDGEASSTADGDPSDEKQDPQIEVDMTALLPAERDANEVLMEFNHIQSKKLVTGEDGKSKWDVIGEGRAYLLKHKETGKIRMLQKVGLGQLALNFEPIKGMSYGLYPTKNTMVNTVFQDHIHCNPPKLERFYLVTETANQAEELVDLLQEAARR
ncbi:hypothetical protein M409DRAFT_52492 [Zasmidium cellare ATCC 36951]|uniref:RanBD1 domain-containing protein n=1 Tax=Zasmidium cellare ATCC 36951 TaxID=1080233 RepID=A0A6A6CQ72_ZASCE|nr:uncharacterized protein M409DRAFT_52492 [Zasmidium cellare ATCC 36951]KAF2169221.1 hypothetical protein M409DRAFT_52492 [Zasmidium cellare ATCC 36951]